MAPFSELDPGAFALPADVVRRTLTPALVIRLEHARENVRRVIACAGGDPARWRPHLKTTKMPRVWELLLDAGVTRFKCATLREARLLCELARERGVGIDLLVAYPLVEPALGLAGRLAARHPTARLAVLCEDPARAADVPRELGVFVDLDPGMGRTGIPLERLDLALDVARAAGDRFRGLHAYEGHVHGAPADRQRTTTPLYERLLDALAQFRARGLAVTELVTSGTPAFQDALAFEPFRALGDVHHTVSPGTVVFHDRRSAIEVPDLDLLPAAVVMTRVVSRPRPDRATCDAGSKAISADAGDPCAVVLGYPDLIAQSPSEEHLPLDAARGPVPDRGDVLYLVPQHVCTTVNLAEQALIVGAQGQVTVAPVGARAHDLV